MLSIPFVARCYDIGMMFAGILTVVCYKKTPTLRPRASLMADIDMAVVTGTNRKNVWKQSK